MRYCQGPKNSLVHSNELDQEPCGPCEGEVRSQNEAVVAFASTPEQQQRSDSKERYGLIDLRRMNTIEVPTRKRTG
jgi:hypothetical protein